jgi:hypothetical protein
MMKVETRNQVWWRFAMTLICIRSLVSAAGKKVREDDIEKMITMSLDAVERLYIHLFKAIHQRHCKVPGAARKKHGDLTWEKKGSIEVKTYGDNTFRRLLDDCKRFPEYHQWPPVREHVYGEHSQGHRPEGPTAKSANIIAQVCTLSRTLHEHC